MPACNIRHQLSKVVKGKTTGHSNRTGFLGDDDDDDCDDGDGEDGGDDGDDDGDDGGGDDDDDDGGGDYDEDYVDVNDVVEPVRKYLPEAR